MSGLAAGALAIGLLGQTLHAQPLRSDIGPCEARDQTVREWRAVGRPVYLHESRGSSGIPASGQWLVRCERLRRSVAPVAAMESGPLRNWQLSVRGLGGPAAVGSVDEISRIGRVDGWWSWLPR